VKIIIATPLYPPDIAFPAPYIKELATRLSGDKTDGSRDEIVIVTYSEIPEKIPGVQILATSKRRPLVRRLLSYTAMLMRAAQNADVLFVENGASVELPVVLISFIIRTPIIFHISDPIAHTYASQHFLYGLFEKIVQSKAKKSIAEVPLQRPEILPFSQKDTDQFALYEQSWSKHLILLRKVFSELS
jgi:hypothetical protein